ncbi:MAG: leucine-rich repeat protein [Oscillospiraceae bacterium]|nr:leucine-rich repeat protein [Oscillospiraceae bacterium]
MKKLLTLLLTLSVVVTLFSLNAFAATDDIVDSGSCGADVTYILYSDGELVISGTGDMANYLSNEPAPWYMHKDGIQKITIEYGVTSVGDYALSDCRNLTSVTIPNSVKTIGEYGISNCDSLESITIPSSVTTIGNNAFFQNQSLVSVTIPSSVKSIGDYAFYLNKSLVSVTLPSSVTYLGHDVFIHCSNLEKVELSSNLTEISNGLFCHCVNLKTVTMGNKVKYINTGAFEDCPSISNIIYSGTKAQWDEIVIERDGNAQLKKAAVITVPDVAISVNAAGKPKLSWEAISGAAKYQIYRSTSGKTGSFALKTTVTGTSYTNTDAVAGTTYYYKVRAVAADGTKGVFSTPVSVKAVNTTPVPTAATVLNTGKPRVKWNAVPNAAKYQIYRSTTGKTGSFVFKTTVTGTSYTNTDAKAGTTYYYKVKAVFADGTKGNLSTAVSAKAYNPVPTVNGTYIVASGKPKLTWNAVPNAAKYQIYRSTSGKTGSFMLKTTVTGTSYTNTDAKAGTTYYYKVKAVFSDGTKGELSTPVSVKCRYPVPTPKAQLSTAGKPKITWNAVTNAKEYQIYRSTTGKDGSFVKIYTTKGTSYTNTGAKAGTKYYYKVRAVFTNGVIGNLSSPVNITAKK